MLSTRVFRLKSSTTCFGVRTAISVPTSPLRKRRIRSGEVGTDIALSTPKHVVLLFNRNTLVDSIVVKQQADVATGGNSGTHTGGARDSNHALDKTTTVRHRNGVLSGSGKRLRLVSGLHVIAETNRLSHSRKGAGGRA